MKQKYSLFIIFFTCFSFFTYAQKTNKKSALAVPNLRDFDNRKIHFGFSFGFNSSTFSLTENLGYPNPDGFEILSINAESMPGFNLGLIADYHITPILNIRFVPELAFEGRRLIYEIKDELQMIKDVESTVIHFPILLKFRTLRIHNFASYIIGGAMYSIDASSKSKFDNRTVGYEEMVIKTNPNSTSATLGLGTDFFLPYFKFGIELRWNIGLDNVFIQDNSFFSAPIDKLYNRGYQIRLTFEG